MTPQLPGTPVWHSHNEFGVDDDEPVRLGTVTASQFNRKTGDWQVELELEGECAELLWNTHCTQSDAGLSLSLSHGKQSKQPREVSVCFKGMREGSRIITNEKSYRPTEPSQAGKSSGSNRDAAYVSASAKPMSTPGDNRMDTDNAPATNKAAAAAVPGAQSAATAPAPKTNNEMETDATDDYVKRIHKAAAAFPVGPERDAFYKQQIEIHKRTKQLARQNEQLKKRSAAMTQTYATSIMELLRNQGQSTAQLEKDITEKEALDMHAPYMEFVAGAAKGWLQAKQPAPAQTAPAPKEEAHPWDLLLRQATKDDDMDDRALSSVTANKHINGSSGSGIDTKGYDRFEQELKDADLIQASYRPGQYQQQQQRQQQGSSNGDYMTMFNQAMNQQYSDVPLDSVPRHVVGSKMTETINDTPIGPSRKRHRTQE